VRAWTAPDLFAAVADGSGVPAQLRVPIIFIVVSCHAVQLQPLFEHSGE
jgi:hypothetical protein